MTSFLIFNMSTFRAPKKPLRRIPPLIAVDRKAMKPLYQQIYEAYRNKIVRGDLRGGELVPSTRELARALRISRLPVLNAYSQLLAEGHFTSRPGSGTFIAATVPSYARTIKGPRSQDGRRRSVSIHAKSLPRFERPTWAEH